MADGTSATVHISSPGLSAEIALRGAELVRLRDEAGRELLWDGDPAERGSTVPPVAAGQARRER